MRYRTGQFNVPQSFPPDIRRNDLNTAFVTKDASVRQSFVFTTDKKLINNFGKLHFEHLLKSIGNQ